MSEVSIVNEALALVSGPGGGISSLADQSKNGQLAQLFYASSRDAVLEAGNWYFAKKTATLAVPTTGDTHDALVQSGTTYALPDDCLRPVEISPHRDGPKNWTCAAGRTLVTSYPSPVLVYIARIEDPNEFSPQFVKALAAYLAWQFAYPITESNTKAAMLKEYYDEQAKEARTVVGSVGNQRTWKNDRAALIRTRRS